jgi:superfamily II DNA or RNA helicase
MIKLKDYQSNALDAIEKVFKTEKRQFIEMPTGSGKTIFRDRD